MGESILKQFPLFLERVGDWSGHRPPHAWSALRLPVDWAN